MGLTCVLNFCIFRYIRVGGAKTFLGALLLNTKYKTSWNEIDLMYPTVSF